MTEFSGAPFQYNPAITNVNIDGQLAGVMTQFSDDYIIDVVKDSLANRVRVYSLPSPNIVYAYEATFKQLTDGFSSNAEGILESRKRVYMNIINVICDFYNLTFNESDDTDYYSAAYWLYEFFSSKFTEYLKTFYTIFLINERSSIVSALNLAEVRRDNDNTYGYSRKLFNDPDLALIHCNLDYVIDQIDSFNISLFTILSYVYQSNPTLPGYISSIVSDHSGRFFKDYYQTFVTQSKESADILTYIKLNLQQLGGQIEPNNN